MGKKLEFYTVDLKYVEKLHQIDKEVFYDANSQFYEHKPYIGILTMAGGYDYFIPLTSAKQKHVRWKNVTRDNYLIYEMVPEYQVTKRQIYKQVPGTGMVKHILSVLEIKKMIPVKEGWYQKIDFSKIESQDYRALLQKEYFFLRPLASSVQQKAEKIYVEQKETGVIHPFYCNFSRLESICDIYQG